LAPDKSEGESGCQMSAKHLVELEIVTDDVAVSLSRLEKLEDLMDSAAGSANNAAIAARLHEVAYKLGIVSARITALAWSINAGY
jgi:hypothetical protein